MRTIALDQPHKDRFALIAEGSYETPALHEVNKDYDKARIWGRYGFIAVVTGVAFAIIFSLPQLRQNRALIGASLGGAGCMGLMSIGTRHLELRLGYNSACGEQKDAIESLAAALHRAQDDRETAMIKGLAPWCCALVGKGPAGESKSMGEIDQAYLDGHGELREQTITAKAMVRHFSNRPVPAVLQSVYSAAERLAREPHQLIVFGPDLGPLVRAATQRSV